MNNFLMENKYLFKKIVEFLSTKFDYASLFATNVSGKSFYLGNRTTQLSDSKWGERGIVVRVYHEGRYFEHSINDLTKKNYIEKLGMIEHSIKEELKKNVKFIKYPSIDEDKIEKEFISNGSINIDLFESKEIFNRLKSFNERASKVSDLLVEFISILNVTKVSKMFLSLKKDLFQEYVWSEAYLIPVVRKNGITKQIYNGFSGLKGLDILDEMDEKVEEAVLTAVKVLDAKSIIPGEYDVICAPEAVGVIAHEAFGHGVEMDMFVKNRAKAQEYIGEKIASDIVEMHDGAAGCEQVSSYLFDDEGTLGSDTVIIDKGILKTGISDVLSASILGTKPTGNGKRENFEHKAYSRMTNTFFAKGTDKLEDMIKSVEHGYYLEKMSSGMEDPKDWGIQVIFDYAREIIDGKLTDNYVSPVVMSGYVPDVLSSITKISNDFKLFGNGACGKGYKEWVKVSDGGAYIKMKARLG